VFPNEPEFHLLRAQAWGVVGRASAAVKGLLPLVKHDLYDERLEIQAAGLLMDAGDHARAVNLARRTFQRHPASLLACRIHAQALDRFHERPQGNSPVMPHQVSSALRQCRDMAVHTLKQPEISAGTRLHAVFSLLQAGMLLGELPDIDAFDKSVGRRVGWPPLFRYLDAAAPLDLSTAKVVQAYPRIFGFEALIDETFAVQEAILQQWEEYLSRETRRRHGELLEAWEQHGLSPPFPSGGGGLLLPLECEDVDPDQCGMCLAQGCAYCETTGACTAPDQRLCDQPLKGPRPADARQQCRNEL
jgi:hypothetical protein